MRVFILTKKVWLSAVCIITAAAVSLVAAACMTAASSNRLLPVYCVENDKKQIALTFDAAWTADDVDDLIGILAKYNVKVTVFAVGEWAEKYPDAVKKLAASGHLLANHSDKHKHIDSMNETDFIADVKACNERLERLTGQKVTLYRGPYGEYNNMSVKAVEFLGMQSLQWNCDSLDWKPGYTADKVTACALKNVSSGSVILMHIGAKPMIEALPRIIEKLQKDGYSFVTADKLLMKDNYYIDHAGKQCRSKKAVNSLKTSGYFDKARQT